MYHLIYHSQAQVLFDLDRLAELLEQSRTYNSDHNITGLLLYTPSGQFMQILEGEEEQVIPLYYDKVAQDPRHTNCTVISEGPWARRSFPAWSMGFLSKEPSDVFNTPGYVDFNSLRSLLQKWAPNRPALVHMCLEFLDEYNQTEEEDMFGLTS